MAESSSNTGHQTESCGYCLEGVDKMVDIRRLPCGHEFCLPCLKADKVIKGAIVCVACRYVDVLAAIRSCCGGGVINLYCIIQEKNGFWR